MTAGNVLITGGTGSVGSALVMAFASAGFSVSFQYLTDTSKAAALVEATGATAVKFDLRVAELPPLPPVDVLVNNAAINISRDVTGDVTDAEWSETMAVNLTGPFRLIRATLPHMIEQRWGRIINISSIYGLCVASRNLPYNVSKHGLRALTATVAKEYAALGVTSNEICPGPIESTMMTRIAAERATSGSGRDYLLALAASIPADRLALPTDVAAVALFLASPAAAYITGVSLPVDGGLTL